METQTGTQEQALENDKNRTAEKKKKQPKSNKFKWWQSLLLLTGTLVISVVSAYFVCEKYFWSNVDTQHLVQQLASAKAAADKKPNDPKSHVNLGYAYFLNKSNDDAIKQYKMAIDLDKNDFDAYFNLGIVYNEENQLNDAVKMAQKATELSPKDYKGHLLKGMALRKLKKYKDAINELNTAKKLQPTDTDVIFEIGRVMEDSGDKKTASAVYKEALSYDPLYKPAIEGLKRVGSSTAKNN